MHPALVVRIEADWRNHLRLRWRDLERRHRALGPRDLARLFAHELRRHDELFADGADQIAAEFASDGLRALAWWPWLEAIPRGPANEPGERLLRRIGAVRSRVGKKSWLTVLAADAPELYDLIVAAPRLMLSPRSRKSGLLKILSCSIPEWGSRTNVPAFELLLPLVPARAPRRIVKKYRTRLLNQAMREERCRRPKPKRGSDPRAFAEWLMADMRERSAGFAEAFAEWLLATFTRLARPEDRPRLYDRLSALPQRAMLSDRARRVELARLTGLGLDALESMANGTGPIPATVRPQIDRLLRDAAAEGYEPTRIRPLLERP